LDKTGEVFFWLGVSVEEGVVWHGDPSILKEYNDSKFGNFDEKD
jgi:hypothetical protein